MKQHRMRWILSSIIALIACMSLSAQQAKRVYITLDVSGSMSGNKYALANYTTQMIVTLCDDDDVVRLIIAGKDNNLSSSKKALMELQFPLNYYGKNPLIPAPPQSDPNFEINDIITFNKLYKPSNRTEDWLFVIGDGKWEYRNEYLPTIEKFGEIVGKGDLNVCYLQTGNALSEENGFTKSVKPFGVVDIRKSDTNPQTIKEGCDHFARKILGFSDVPFQVKNSGGKCISIKTELPLQSFFLVYQDETKSDQLPLISSATAGGKLLQTKLKGTPSTTPLKTNRNEVDLSGHVYHVQGNGTIPANTDIEVCFDKDVNPENVSIYPLVKEVEFGSFGFSPAGGKLKQVGSKTFCISSSEKSAIVRIELNEASKKNLPESLLKKTAVVVKANGKEYKAKNKNGAFECEIDLVDEETQYYAECDCPGYFKRVTPIMTIEKGDCEPEAITSPELPVMKQPMMDFGPMTFEALKRDPLRFYIHKIGEKDALDPQKFDISVKVENGFLYEDPQISFDNDTIQLDIRPLGKWCECLFPKEINFTIISTPKQGAFEKEGVSYSRVETPGRVPILKENPWAVRCFWVLVTLATLLLFILYLRGLLKKNRFHKNARLRNSYVVDDNPKEVQKNGRRMRKPGFNAWFDRWLNPFGDEKNSINFTRPKTPVMSFTASESKNKVLLSEASYNPDKMTIPLYNPRLGGNDKKTKEPIGISAGTAIEIKKTQGGESTRLGHVLYVVEGKDDVGGYRLFIGLLMALSIVSFMALVIMLIRGIMW